MTAQPLHPSDLGLILTYKCQCECAHCIYNCGPAWGDWMKPEQIRAALEATLIWERPYQVHLTGGEAFLKFPLLLEATEIAVELGISVYVETNAGWCVGEELVERRLRALRQAGMRSILISCSPFHGESIPLEHTELAIRKAWQIFGQQNTFVYISDWFQVMHSFGSQNPVPLEMYSQVFGQEEAGRMFWQGYGLISGGRAGYRLAHLTPKGSPRSFQKESCAGELLYAPHSHFDLYGNFIPAFCGGLSLGSWHDLPGLSADFQNGNFPGLIQTLIEAGPYGLYEMAREQFDYRPLKTGYTGKCHLCVDIRRHLVTREAFPELQPIDFYENF
jgi:hypothetical protein